MKLLPNNAGHELPHRVSGSHAHALTSVIYTYKASYLLLGTMLDWTAHVRADGRTDARIGGSIRLSRGQTRSIAPTLVEHMVAQAIDAMCVAAVPA